MFVNHPQGDQPMQKHTLRRRLTGAVAVTGLLALAAPATGLAAETLYGVTDSNRLISFSSQSPLSVRTTLPITGIQPNEQILGIDVRPADDRLYGLGSTNRVYRINPVTGTARPVIAGPFTPGLNGANFGFDFNPQADRLRIVSDADQNLRLVPDTLAVTNDGALTYGAGSNPNVSASAYTNNRPGVTSTQLFGIDVDRDALVLQNPPNSGTLAVVGTNLGVQTSDPVSFDISAVDGAAYAVLQVAGESRSQLYRIDLATGKASKVSPFASIGTSGRVRALAALGFEGNDRGRPGVLVSTNPRPGRARLRSSGLSADVSVSETSVIDTRLRIGNVTIGSLRGVEFLRPSVRRLNVRLTATGRRLVALPGSRTLTLRVTARDAAGNATTRTVVLRTV